MAEEATEELGKAEGGVMVWVWRCWAEGPPGQMPWKAGFLLGREDWATLQLWEFLALRRENGWSLPNESVLSEKTRLRAQPEETPRGKKHYWWTQEEQWRKGARKLGLYIVGEVERKKKSRNYCWIPIGYCSGLSRSWLCINWTLPALFHWDWVTGLWS